MTSHKAKLVAVLGTLVLLAIFLPPNINGTRFRDRLAPSLSAALGRQVRIGAVKYRLFPRPGFDLYDFQVMDDPAFGAEPMLMCGKVTADLRLTSLWKGRIEFANLKLTDDAAPPSLNLSYADGRWNLESLLARAGQVPSAPTSRRRAEQRPRFPYIEASGGRINFKKGSEKKSWALANTDFAFWLAAEDLWHFRLEGRPVRTDMNLSDTGTVRLEGDLHRSASLQDMPLKLNLSWEKTQLGQFSKLVSGQDHGWRGDLEGTAQLTGTLARMHLSATADLSHFHRYDVNRDSMARLRTRCLGDFKHGALDLKCNAPLDPGGLLLTARWSATAPLDYDLSVVANHLPMSAIAILARHIRASLPDDLSATGDCNAAFGFHSHNGERDWHGTGMSTPFLLESALADKPFPVSSIRFHIGAAPTPPVGKKSRQAVASPGPDANKDANRTKDPFTLDSFSVQLGPSTVLDIQGTFDGVGYRTYARGMVPLERLLVLAKLAGFSVGFSNDAPSLSASAIVDFNLAGNWKDAAPARVHGTAHIQNLTAWVPGAKNRLALTQAEAELTDSALVLSRINGEFEHSPITFTGRIERPWSCGTGTQCPLEFELHADKLAVADLSALVGVNDRGWWPFSSGSSGKLPDFRAQGTFTAGELRLANLPLQNFNARIEIGDKTLVLSHVLARLAGGDVEGDWRGDWAGAQPRFESSGTLTGVDLGRLASGQTQAQTETQSEDQPGLQLIASWLTGRAQAKYALQLEGKTPAEMFLNASARAEFTISAGDSRLLLLQAGKPLKFQTVQGTAELGKQVLTIHPSKIRSENRIYEVSGKVMLRDGQTNLKISSGGSRWEVTGAMDKPRISAQPLTAQSTSGHSQ